MHNQSIATPADLVRFAFEIDRIHMGYLVTRNALSEARRIEGECSDRGDRRGVFNALKRVVERTQTTFDLWVQFVLIAVETDQVTSLAQRLELLAADARLAPAFRATATIGYLIRAGVDGEEGSLGPLHQLILWGTDPMVRLCAQRAREELGWLRAGLLAEERGAILSDCPGVLQ